MWAMPTSAQQRKVNAIVRPQMDMLLAGTIDGKWRQPEELARLLRGGESYGLYTLSKRVGTAKGTEPKWTEDGPAAYHQIQLSPLPRDLEGVIAVGGGWNAQPRAAKTLSTSQPVYRKAVGSYASGKGFGKSNVRINQLQRVDLEGNGVDEVLISASSRDPQSLLVGSKKGDYSCALLRKIVGGQVKTSELGWFGATKNRPEGEAPYFETHRVEGMLDLDGDGVMEVVTCQRYYEGESFLGFTVQGGKLKQLFSNGIGA
jgi:hypothetical protein